jgi:hypothetical protein
VAFEARGGYAATLAGGKKRARDRLNGLLGHVHDTMKPLLQHNADYACFFA